VFELVSDEMSWPARAFGFLDADGELGPVLLVVAGCARPEMSGSKPARFEALVKGAMLDRWESSGAQLGRGSVDVRWPLRRLEALQCCSVEGRDVCRGRRWCVS
jgi:hypothetical protein